MTAGKMNVKEKIKDIHFYRAVSDISRPIADSTHTISQIGFYIVELMTAEGVRGQGYVLSFHYSPGAMEGALRDVCSFISAGEYAVYDTVLARADWDREAEYFGNTGINNCAIAAVNLGTYMPPAGVENAGGQPEKDTCIRQRRLDFLHGPGTAGGSAGL